MVISHEMYDSLRVAFGVDDADFAKKKENKTMKNYQPLCSRKAVAKIKASRNFMKRWDWPSPGATCDQTVRFRKSKGDSLGAKFACDLRVTIKPVTNASSHPFDITSLDAALRDKNPNPSENHKV
jgi:hypothetical protein